MGAMLHQARPGPAWSAVARPGLKSVERDPLVPVRDVGGQSERADLGLQGDLRVGIAVDEEHPARVASITRSLALDESAQPAEQLGLVGMGGEAADRADLAAYRPLLPIEPDEFGAGLEVRPERP